MSKVQIRQGLFETNSSSTHSITIVDAEDYNNWKSNKVWFREYNGVFLPIEEAIDANIREIKNTFLEDDEELPESFKEAYHRTKDMKAAFEETKNDFEFELGYDDVKWESTIYRSYEEWKEVIFEYYEDFNKEYTTKHGDKVVVFGYYGYN